MYDSLDSSQQRVEALEDNKQSSDEVIVQDDQPRNPSRETHLSKHTRRNRDLASVSTTNREKPTDGKFSAAGSQTED